MRRIVGSLVVAGALTLVPSSAHGHAVRTADAALGTLAADVAPAGTWCGSERMSDDVAHESTAPRHRLHALYLVPSDAPSRLGAVAGTIQASADAASGFLARSRGRGLRFDRGTHCGSRHLDITTVRLPLTTAALQRAADAGDTFDRVSAALIKRGIPLVPADELFTARNAGEVNQIAWLDAPAPAGTCGQATIVSDERRSARNDNARGGKLALIFRRDEGFCGARTVLHETLHTLGAVQDPAPHATSDGHCADVSEDVMCLPSAPAAGLGEAAVDAGSDDYWDPPTGAPLRWWTVNLSPFLCSGAGCEHEPGARAAARRSLTRSRARRSFRT